MVTIHERNIDRAHVHNNNDKQRYCGAFLEAPEDKDVTCECGVYVLLNLVEGIVTGLKVDSLACHNLIINTPRNPEWIIGDVVMAAVSPVHLNGCHGSSKLLLCGFGGAL